MVSCKTQGCVSIYKVVLLFCCTLFQICNVSINRSFNHATVAGYTDNLILVKIVFNRIKSFH